jgi:hypothetical protein
VYIVDKIYNNQRLYIVSLIILFIGAFALPLVFAFLVGGYLSGNLPDSIAIFNSDNKPADSQDKETQEKDVLFPDALVVAGPNVFLDVKHSPALEPQPGKDFLISVWVKLKKLPETGESFVIFSKFDEKSAARKGYSFSLTMEQDKLRPGIYWRDENNGTWFTFSEVGIKPKTWNLFVISFRDEKYLGLHTAQFVDGKGATDEAGVKLLGGYELTNKIFPQNKMDFQAGSFGSGKFRGKIGPVGIFSSQSITKELDPILASFVENPTEVPDFFNTEDVALWLPHGKSDESGKNNSVSISHSKRTD